MAQIDYNKLLLWLKGQTVDRPNSANNGTLSGHAAGEPFEKSVYHYLKSLYPQNIFKQFEYLNDLYQKHPQSITPEDKKNLFDSPVALFLLSRSDSATRKWNPTNVFEEKQDDTADILYHENDYFELIDIKTRNISKKAMPPNIISAYKVAKMCALMTDNNDFETVGIKYIEIDWNLNNDKLVCTHACMADLFKCDPHKLYINWAAAMQIQFHVEELEQTFNEGLKKWTKEYLKAFVSSARHRCQTMYDTYVTPFMKYIE